MTIRERDLRALMRLVVDGERDTDAPDEPLPWSVLHRLRELLLCDEVSFFRLDTTTGTVDLTQELSYYPVRVGGEGDDLFLHNYWDTKSCSYPDRAGDLDSIVRRSDFYSPSQFRAIPMWEYAQPFEHDLLACLAGVPGRTLRLVFFRCCGSDFDDDDVAAVYLLRPHLLRLYRRRREARSGRASLTPRQRELLGLVATGYANRQIGRRLGISESTARKHLENVFERLDVTSRTAAVARAFPDGPAD